MEDENAFELAPAVIKKLETAKIFKDHKNDVNSFDFSSDGKLLVTCDDVTLNLYNVQEARKLKTLYNKVNKMEIIRFTHHNEAILCACKSPPYYIFYWSVYDNEIIRRFVGHKDTILCLEMNPADDIFASSAKDQTVKIWSLASEDENPDGVLDLSSKKTNGIVSFDPKGVVMAVAYVEGSSSNGIITKLRLYDVKHYQEGSFASKNLECPEVKMLKFSNDGLNILLTTTEDYLLLVDAYDLSVRRKIGSFANDSGLRIEASFTPDSKYILSGSENGQIHIWDLEGTEIVKLDGHPKAVMNVKFNPKFALMASACTNVILWLPKEWPSS